MSVSKDRKENVRTGNLDETVAQKTIQDTRGGGGFLKKQDEAVVTGELRRVARWRDELEVFHSQVKPLCTVTPQVPHLGGENKDLDF